LQPGFSTGNSDPIRMIPEESDQIPI
jgi:hypothetical protein